MPFTSNEPCFRFFEGHGELPLEAMMAGIKKSIEAFLPPEHRLDEHIEVVVKAPGRGLQISFWPKTPVGGAALARLKGD